MLGKNNPAKKPDQLSQQNGFISLLILLVTFFLSWIGIMTYMKVSSQERIIQYETLKTQVSYTADSGLEIAEAKLEADMEWEGGVYHISDSTVKVAVERQNGSFRIIASAESGKVRQTRYGILTYGDKGQLFLSDYGYIYE